MRGRAKARIAHLAVIIAGLIIVAYPFTLGASPAVTCRGEVMSAGDTCAKADGSEQQTYDERAEAISNAKPVIIGVGIVVAGFGVVLLAGEVRRGRRGRDGDPRTQEASGSSPIGP